MQANNLPGTRLLVQTIDVLRDYEVQFGKLLEDCNGIMAKSRLRLVDRWPPGVAAEPISLSRCFSGNKILVLDGDTPLPVPVCVPVSWNTAAGADTGTGEDDQVFLGDEKVLQQFPRITVYRSARL